MKIFPEGLRQKMPTALDGTLAGQMQGLRMESEVVAHVQSYRQSRLWATEAGGQLFGLIDENLVRVIRATGPYAGDERSRYRYRSNAKAAQQAIEEQFRSGLLYLGEWHTHAEDYPSASSLDNDAMLKLMKNSNLNSNILLMLIAGRKSSPAGLGLWSVASSNVDQWSLSIPVCSQS